MRGGQEDVPLWQGAPSGAGSLQRTQFLSCLASELISYFGGILSYVSPGRREDPRARRGHRPVSLLTSLQPGRCYDFGARGILFGGGGNDINSLGHQWQSLWPQPLVPSPGIAS